MNDNAITTTVKPQAITASATDFAAKLQIADYLIHSGFLPQSLKTVPQVVTIMMMSEELGIGYWQGFNGINVIQGKPTTSPQLMLAKIYQSGHAEEVKVDVVDGVATCTMKRRGMSAHVETFSMDDANKLGLASKQNWRQQPQVMLKWRVVAACARVVFPDVIMGMYTADEMGATVNYDDTGNEVVIVTPEPPEPPTTPPTPPSTPTTPPAKAELPKPAIVERVELDISPAVEEALPKAAGAENEAPPSPFSQSKKVETPLNSKKLRRGATQSDGLGPAFAQWTKKHNVDQATALAAMNVKYLSEWASSVDEMLDLLRNHFHTRDDEGGEA